MKKNYKGNWAHFHIVGKQIIFLFKVLFVYSFDFVLGMF